MPPETEEFQALLDLCNQVCDGDDCTHLVTGKYIAWCTCCLQEGCEEANEEQLAAKRAVKEHYDRLAADWKDQNYV